MRNESVLDFQFQSSKEEVATLKYQAFVNCTLAVLEARPGPTTDDRDFSGDEAVVIRKRDAANVLVFGKSLVG